MLNEQEQREIDEVLRHGKDNRACISDALKIVQKHRRWVCDEAVADVAGALAISASEVESIATFYNQIFRRKVGRHVIQICDSVSCWVTGYENIRDALERRLDIRLGETTADGRFTLVPSACLGACDKAPVMMVDEDLHENLTGEKIEAILGQYP